MSGRRPPQASDRIALAGSDVSIPPLGVGTWAWGDKGTWGMGGYDSRSPSRRSGMRGRPASRRGSSSSTLPRSTAAARASASSAACWRRTPACGDRVVIATKFMPSPWKVNVHAALLSAARHSLRAARCRHDRPVPDPRSRLAALTRRSGRRARRRPRRGCWSRRSACRTTRPRRRAPSTRALRKRGLRLASNQIEFSLLRTMPLRVGLLDRCHELGVVPLAYSPIGQGRLTGKYSAANPPPGKRTFSAHPMEQVDAHRGRPAPHR